MSGTIPRTIARTLPCLALAACWSGSKPTAAATRPPTTPSPARAPSLAIEDQTPGRLVLDRKGTAWEVTCDGKRLTKRPWQGGAWVDIGACDYSFRGMESLGLPHDEGPAIAIDGDTVAVFSDRAKAIIVTRGGVERRIPSTVRGVVALAIDGNAILAVVTYAMNGSLADVTFDKSLAAIVRVENDKGTAHELVRYMSTGASVDPRFVTAGRDRMLIVAKTGNSIVCDYKLRCGEPRMNSVGELQDAVPLADGGMVVIDWESSVSRIGADGIPMWTQKGWPMLLLGTTATHVWFATRHDDPRAPGFPVHAISLKTGADEGYAAILYLSRDEFGRFLNILGVAPTPDGPVIRGTFGGTLTAGRATIETKTRGGLCWWENPHNGHEYEIKPEETCDERHQKAILTEHKAFVGIGAEVLRSKKWTSKSVGTSP